MKVLNSINANDQRLPIRLLLLLGLMTVFTASALAQGSGVCLYDQPNYRGRSVCVGPGQAVSELAGVRGGWNDRAMSIRVLGNTGATIYEHAGFTGASFYVDSDIPDLGQLRRGRGGLAGEISSITVGERGGRQFGRRSDFDEAYRLGQRDSSRGFSPNYRQYTSRYDRLGEAEFRRGYNEGYRAARSGNNNDVRYPRTFPNPNLR